MKKHILVIDDDESIRKSLSRILERNGYEVSTASDGLEGITKFQGGGSVDLIIADIFMPNLDGIDVLLDLKTRNANVKIISISGREDFYLDATKDLGAHCALKKPFSNDELLTAIKSLLPD